MHRGRYEYIWEVQEDVLGVLFNDPNLTTHVMGRAEFIERVRAGVMQLMGIPIKDPPKNWKDGKNALEIQNIFMESLRRKISPEEYIKLSTPPERMETVAEKKGKSSTPALPLTKSTAVLAAWVKGEAFIDPKAKAQLGSGILDSEDLRMLRKVVSYLLLLHGGEPDVRSQVEHLVNEGNVDVVSK